MRISETARAQLTVEDLKGLVAKYVNQLFPDYIAKDVEFAVEDVSDEEGRPDFHLSGAEVIMERREPTDHEYSEIMERAFDHVLSGEPSEHDVQLLRQALGIR